MPPDPPTKRPTKVGPAARSKAESASLSVFDFPSDDDQNVRTQPKRATAKLPRRADKGLGAHGASEDSASEQLRREEAVAETKRLSAKSSDTSIVKGGGTTSGDTGSGQRRIRKQVSTNVSKSQGHRKTSSSAAVSETGPTAESTSAAKVLSMVRSRRTQAKPENIRTAMSKGKSAPALLQQMLPSPETKPSSPAEPTVSTPKPELSEDEDANVSFPATPPARTSNSPFGTVTPRQTQAWSKLLDFTEKSSPGILPLDELKITSAVRPNQSRMQRSASDMTAAAGAQKRRLIDTLKQNATQDESCDDEDDETMLDEEDLVALNSASQSKLKKSYGKDSGSFERFGSSQEATSSQSVAVVATGPKHTYSNTRTYLNDGNQNDLFDIPMLEELAPVRKTLVPQDDDLEDSASGMRNIHELRAAGTARRVMDDLEALLDDIEQTSPKSTSRRRTALLELCQKLQDKTYVAHMTEHSLDRRIFASLAKTKDPILGFGMASAIGIVVMVEAPRSTLEEVHQTGCLGALAFFSKMNTDISKIARDRKTNMSRLAQGSWVEFRDAIGAIMWPEKTPATISPGSVALKTMEMVVRKLRENGNTEDLLGYQTLADVAELAHGPTQRLSSASATESDIDTLELVLSTLESASINATAWKSRSDESMNQLVKSIDALLAPESSSEQLDALARRLILNITNNNPKNCDVFAKDSLVRNLMQSISTQFQALSTDLDEFEHMKTVEHLILSCGVLINLAEFSDRARAATLGDCDEMLDSLVTTSVVGIERAAQAESIDVAHSGVAYGYLTVLLGNLCQNAAIREKVRAKLPNQRFDVHIRAIHQFRVIHQKVDGEAFEGEEGTEVWTTFTERLQGVIDRLKSY
ncbi:wings apart-like protein regulation of heterochromatin-domain-containing protein [Phyllosticta citrichinensis]|uniref:Wings apart-like protein regulation of heterochromatin-domain-containing protein n=1 Tax=Phyllosticta citrichinensis TaxID=1130410 RepID=A0ABR1XXN3_9PEZI